MSGVTLDYLADEDVKNRNSKALDYNIVRFLPDINQLKIEQPTGSKFLVNPEYDSQPISSRFYQLPGSHTPQSCAINASIIDATARSEIEKNGKQNSAPQLQPGLSFDIVEGYFNDNVQVYFNATRYFDNAKPKSGLKGTSGIATNFTSIITSTNQLIPQLHTIHYYSVKWIGYFYPNESGTWQFSLNSDDSSVMWLGNKAMNDYNMSNLTVDCRNLHGMYTKNGSMYLEKNVYYPIRIYYGENGGGNNCIFGFQAPSGANYGYMGAGYDGKQGPFLFTNGNNFSTSPIIHSGTYFSMVNMEVDNTQSPNFGCYIYGKKTKDNLVQGFNKATVNADYDFMQKNLSDVTVISAWSFIDSTSDVGLGMLRNDPANTSIKLINGILYLNGNIITKMIQSGDRNCKATIQNDGQFVIKDSTGKVVWGLNQINNNDDYGDTPDGTQRIATSSFSKIVESAQPNNVWMNANASDTLQNGQGLSYMGKIPGTYPFLISKNGKFKIDMDNVCNLNLKISMTISVNTLDFNTNISGQPSKYIVTNANDQYMYLNLITADSKLLNTYSHLSGDKTVSLVDPKAKSLNYKTGDYTQYQGYYPSSLTGNGTVTNDGPENCKTKCRSNPDCMYYYTYLDNNNSQQCYTNIDGTPLTFSIDPAADGDNINPHKSTLYVKNPDIKVSNYFGNADIIKSKSTNDYKTGLPAPHSLNPSPLNSINMVINRAYEQEYADYVSYLTGKNLGTPLYIKEKNDGPIVPPSFGRESFTGSSLKEGLTPEGNASNDLPSENAPPVSNIVHDFKRIWDAQNPEPPGFSSQNPLLDEAQYVESTNFNPTSLFGEGGYKDNSTALKQFRNPDPPTPMLQFFSDKQNSSSYKGYGNIVKKGPIYEFPNMVQGINYNEERLVLTSDPTFQTIKNPNNAFSFASVEGGIKFPKTPVVGVGHNPGITFSFWYRSDFSSDWARIFDFGSSMKQGSRMCCCIKPDGILFYNQNGWSQIDSTPYVQGGNDGQWHYVYWSISGSGEPWNIYIDNVKQTIAFPNSGIPEESMPCCLFGASLWFIPNGDPFFNGAISDFKIFDCVLEHSFAEKYYNTVKSKYINNIEGFEEGFFLSPSIEHRYIPLDKNGFTFNKSSALPGYTINTNGSSKFNGGMAYMYKGNLGSAPTPDFMISKETPGTIQNRMSGSVKFDGDHYVHINDPVQITKAGVTISFWFRCSAQSTSIAGHLFTCYTGNDVIMGAVVHNNNMWIIINESYYNTKKVIVDAWQQFIWVVNPDGTSNLSINTSPLSELRYTNIINPQSLTMLLGANYTWYYKKMWNGIPNVLINGAFVGDKMNDTFNNIIWWSKQGGCGGHQSGYKDPWGFPAIDNKAVMQGRSTLQQAMFIPPGTYNLGYWHAERPGYGASTYTITLTSSSSGKSINTTNLASDQALQKKIASSSQGGYNPKGWTNVNIQIVVPIADYYLLTIQNNQSGSDNSIGLAYMILVTIDSKLYEGYINKLHIYNKALSSDSVDKMNKGSSKFVEAGHVDGFTTYEPFSSQPSIIEGMNATPGVPSSTIVPSLTPAVTAPSQFISGKQLKTGTFTYPPVPTNYTSSYKRKSQIFSEEGGYNYSDYLKNTKILGSAAKEYGNQRNQIIQNLKTSQEKLGLNTLVTGISNLKHQMGDNTYGDEVIPTTNATTIATNGLSSSKYQYGNIFDKDKLLNVNDVASVAKSDSRQLILQENTIHSIGLITCATLLITSIMLARE